MAIRATRILRILVMCWTSRFFGSDAVVHAVASQAQVIHGTELQHSRVRGTMRYVTGHAAVGLNGSMFKRKWTLLIRMAFQAGGVSPHRQSRLLQLETAVRIVAVAAAHGAFEDLVMGGHGELMFHFTVTTQAQLRFTDF